MSAADRINPATVQPLAPLQSPGTSPAGPARTTDGRTFEDVLRTKVQGATAPNSPAAPLTPVPDAAPGSSLKWSAHASARLAQRGIELSPAQHARVETAVDKAAAKGAKDALVMLDDTAMVVSVQNRTVITALGMSQAKDNVFTNIDSAVFA